MELFAIQLRLKWKREGEKCMLDIFWNTAKKICSIFCVGCDDLSLFWMNVKSFVGILWNLKR